MAAATSPSESSRERRAGKRSRGAGGGRVGRRALLALGMSLARRGILPAVAIVTCVSTALVFAIVTALLASRGPEAPAQEVPILASSALAWGGGFLLAFAASAHALRRDRNEGIRELFVARTTSLRGYLLARVFGLAAVIALCVAGGTLLCGAVGLVGAARVGAVPGMLQATAAGVVFAIAFSVVVAPVAFAALGARSRLGGYVFLLIVVTVPEVIVALMGSALPASVADVLSIPSALSALRSALSPGTVDPWRAVRAVIALGVVVALAMLLVRRDADLVDGPEGDP